MGISSFGGRRGEERGIYMQYFTGDFDGQKFINDNPADKELMLDYGDCFYAAIPWNNVPNHQKTFIGCMVPGPAETSPCKGQMSIARDLSLMKTPDGIRLVQKPASLVKNNLSKLSNNSLQEIKQIELNNQEIEIAKQKIVKNNSYWLEAELDVSDGVTSGFKIAQKKDADNNIIEATEIGYDAGKKQVYVDKIHSGKGSIKKDKVRQTIDLSSSKGKVKVEILFDKSSLEIFVNGGEEVLTTYIFPGEGANVLSAFAVGGKSIIGNVKIWHLSNMK